MCLRHFIRESDQLELLDWALFRIRRWNYWQNEFRSLRIESKRRSRLNGKKELQALVHSIKQVYYQDYKAACNQEDGDKTNASDFGYII